MKKNHTSYSSKWFCDKITLPSKKLELEEKATLLQHITDNMFDLVSLTDPQGNFTFAGKSHQILGYDPQYLIGQNVMDFVHPEDYNDVMSAFTTFLQTRKDSQGIKYRIRCQDESYLWLETMGKVILTATGEIKELLFSSRNITHQKREEAQLKKMIQSTQRFLETTSEINPQAIAEDMRCLTGAAYVVFNQFDENGKDFTTLAFVGDSDHLMKAVDIMGFNPIGKKWTHDPDRLATMKQTRLTTFENLEIFAGNHLPIKILRLLEKSFDIGQTIMVHITQNQKLMGHFALIMPKDILLENPELTTLYATQVGMYLDRIKHQQQLQESKEALQKSEAIVRNKLRTILEPEIDLSILELEDIIDVPAVQNLLTYFHRFTGMLGAIVDNKGQVLVSVGWQDICTQFHRRHPKTRKYCMESDTFLAKGARSGTFKSYRCKNGMNDIASPIEVAGRHLGNIYFGQFFYTDEQPDIEEFRQKSRLYDFDETKYLEALSQVPRYPRKTVDDIIHFYSGLADMISSLSFSNLSLAQAITRQREAEEKLQEYAKELEQKNLELDQALTSAKYANEAKSRYLAHMNHEIRTPLNGLLGFIQLLESTNMDEEQQELMTYLKASSNHMLGIVNNVLDHAKIEAGEMKLILQPFVLEDEIKSALAPLYPLALEKNLHLHIKLARALPRKVVGDSQRFRQILLNLAGNAVKFTEQGHIVTTLVCQQNFHSHHQLRLVVEDTGPGMTKETLHKLFQPFYEANDGSVEQPKGTGLGLVITRELIELMGGQILVKSTIGKGTKVEVTLPVGKMDS